MKRTLIILLYKLAYRLNLWRRRWLRPLNFGVKIMLIRDDQIFLVRHTYRGGWFIPGGGLKRGETLEEAARREAWEEVGATLNEIALFGLYSNIRDYNNDHIAVFISNSFTLSGQQDYEIAEAAFFPIHNPPSDADDGCHKRLQEYRHSLPLDKVRTW